jgi:MarR family 2-MHQ and catechol resistance regulon transcriptional repressor
MARQQPGGPADDEDDLHFMPARLGADVDALLVFNLLRTETYLNPFIDRSLRQKKVTPAQLNAMMVLRSAGGEGLPLSEIGRRLVVTKANVTGLVDRLERDGLVERVAQPDDRRVTIGRLTDDGARLLEDILPSHQELLAELTAGLTDDEKEQLIVLLTKLRRGLRLRREREAQGD